MSEIVKKYRVTLIEKNEVNLTYNKVNAYFDRLKDAIDYATDQYFCYNIFGYEIYDCRVNKTIVKKYND